MSDAEIHLLPPLNASYLSQLHCFSILIHTTHCVLLQLLYLICHSLVEPWANVKGFGHLHWHSHNVQQQHIFFDATWEKLLLVVSPVWHHKSCIAAMHCRHVSAEWSETLHLCQWLTRLCQRRQQQHKNNSRSMLLL